MLRDKAQAAIDLVEELAQFNDRRTAELKWWQYHQEFIGHQPDGLIRNLSDEELYALAEHEKLTEKLKLAYEEIKKLKSLLRESEAKKACPCWP